MTSNTIGIVRARRKLFVLSIWLKLLVLVCSMLAPPCWSQTGPVFVPAMLDFESDTTGQAPQGWAVGPQGAALVVDNMVHGGKHALQITPKAGDPDPHVYIAAVLPMDFQGRHVQLRGYLRTENVTGSVSLWMRQDGVQPNLHLVNMEPKPVTGTRDWKQYSIEFPVDANALNLALGVYINGTGRAWVDDFELLVDGKPYWNAAKVVRQPTVLETDLEFANGSNIHLSTLSETQLDHLATLGKVWGFLKYHHPRVTSGDVHWDFALLRVLPDVLAAQDAKQLDAILLRWIDALGPLSPCQACAIQPKHGVYLQPHLAWLDDPTQLGEALRQRLKAIHQQRPELAKHFYVSMAPAVGNPQFEHELPYLNMPHPDAGLQLLSVLRLWNMVEYWFPYRDIIGEEWDPVLRTSIAKVALAQDFTSYQKEMIALIARIHDSHANLWNALSVRPPEGDCNVPANVRFLDQQLVVSGDAQSKPPTASGLQPGDVITSIDGQPVASLVRTWSPYYPASNDAAMLRDMSANILSGSCEAARLQVQRDRHAVDIAAPRVSKHAFQLANTHDRPGPTFQMLSKDVAYLKLSSIKRADVASYLAAAANAQGLIIDIRNYPAEFVVFTLGNHLVSQPQPFVHFTAASVGTPGQFSWSKPISLEPSSPHYFGKVVILVDEISQSQSEYTTMALRAVSGAVVVGSTTAGADGNYSAITLPGGLSTGISGLGVFYPDGRPTQRIGIVPDVSVVPTVQGLRDGRDEVLEAGIRQILGMHVAQDTIDAIVMRQ